jgi:hypothetical protein
MRQLIAAISMATVVRIINHRFLPSLLWPHHSKKTIKKFLTCCIATQRETACLVANLIEYATIYA